MSSSALRRLGALAFALLLAAAVAGASTASGSRSGGECCTVTYNKAKTHVQVTGFVRYKGTPVLFSFHGPCASPAGPGRAYVKSRWIPLREIVAGFHSISIVQKVDGKIVYTRSPRFFIKGTAQLRKPVARILSGPSGVVDGTRFTFKIKTESSDRLMCRLDATAWSRCSYPYVSYDGVAPGPHVFQVRAYALSGKGYAEAKRSFAVNAPEPGAP